MNIVHVKADAINHRDGLLMFVPLNDAG